MKYFLDSAISIIILALVGSAIGIVRVNLRRYHNDR